jgi:hypothetical protein
VATTGLHDALPSVEARSRALVTEGEAAEPWYAEAVTRLARTPFRTELGRAHLLYAEWLRREGRRVDAREQLTRAYEMFLSVRTLEWPLRKVFIKLDVRSRKDLKDALPSPGQNAAVTA